MAERIEDLMPIARSLAKERGVFVSDPGGLQRRSAQPGFISYGEINSGDRVLFAVSRVQDPMVVQAMKTAFEERGASVDLLVVGKGPVDPYVDRELTQVDEVKAIIRRVPWWEQPRKYDGIVWVEDMAERLKYDALVHGDPLTGGPVPPMDRKRAPYKYFAAVWNTREAFASPATLFPMEVNKLANEKSWNVMWKEGRGAKVRITDPEGTDITFTLWDDYYTPMRYGWGPVPTYGHMLGHPAPPILHREDASGVVVGTTSHFNRPFPKIKVSLENGRITRIEGGGEYGDAWRALLEETSGLQYPEYPGTGLFWLAEVAIGTNPKVSRPKNVLMTSSGGMEYDRSRSGVIHLGFGTFWRQPSERWAAQVGAPYGHLHVHLYFPTYQLRKGGREWYAIDNGRLTSLDDPDVVQLARKYGDPALVLSEDWVPGIPGINSQGDYEDYARDPASWIAKEAESY